MQKSFASNIFDDTDALSAGIREYVESKIAESFHDRSPPPPPPPSRLNNPLTALPFGTPLNLAVKLRFPSHTHAHPSPSSLPHRARFITSILHDDPKRLGPFVFAYSHSIAVLQLGICLLYVLALLFAALAGPLALLVIFWRTTVFLVGYALLGSLCGWSSDEGADLLLVPALFATDAVRKEVQRVVQRYVKCKVEVQVRALREVVLEADVAVEARQ